MEKNIISVGYEIPGRSTTYRPYNSNQSLLDADIIVFQPDFSQYGLDHSSEPYFNGRPCYSKDSSFRLKEDTSHWKTELITALQAGKTVFVLFSKFEASFVHTGDKQFSGTGRNTRTTNIVADYDNYSFFPITLPKIISKSGSAIVFKNHPVFASFWKDFQPYLKFDSYLEGSVTTPLFLTKTGDKAVGAMFKVGSGNLVLLPPFNIEYSSQLEKDPKTKKSRWTKDAMAFGSRFVQALIDIDKSLKQDGESTPPPDWMSDETYQLQSESRLHSKIENHSDAIEKLVSEKAVLLDQLAGETKLKDLLFEKGKVLENAVILALEILEYKAENYDDGSLELDQVIVSPEGSRFIGEVEGKDDAAVNVDKFRQLATNIQEDVQRDEVNEPAKGILFGNGFRLTNPTKREEHFTKKCITTAKAYNYVLVPTTELFKVAKYVKESKDEKFADACRKAISENSEPVVSFPAIPGDSKPGTPTKPSIKQGE